MIIDALLIIFAFWHPTLGIIATVAVLLSFRHVPFIADELVRMGEFDKYDSDTWTARIVHTALPAWGGRDWFMSRAEDEGENNPTPPVHVPVQGTAVVSAKPPADRDIIMDGWIVDMAQAKDEKGRDLFSANDIFKAVGGHRATVLARVKEVRTGEVAQFRTEDGATQPATWPISKDS